MPAGNSSRGRGIRRRRPRRGIPTFGATARRRNQRRNRLADETAEAAVKLNTIGYVRYGTRQQS